MGRKSSAKAQKGSASGAQGSGLDAHPPASKRNIVVGASVVFIAVIGAYAYVANGRATDAPAIDAATPPAAQTIVGDARWAKFGPHKQAVLPPFPTQAFPPPRPMNVVRAVYQFAAEHPEILEYVPCFCGCERAGHKGNHDCFVAARNEKGDVTQWDPHGLDCTVCIDVATEAARLHASGAGVRDIRAAIEQKWAGFHGGHTPTPNPPKGN